jgi:hypothetical protein
MAYVLATVIALRGRWNHDDLNPDGLDIGEALLGDFKNYGMTRQQYRGALKTLVKLNLATRRTTRSGTIARLADYAIFGPPRQQAGARDNQRSTTKQPRVNQPPATNKAITEANQSEEQMCRSAGSHDIEPRVHSKVSQDWPALAHALEYAKSVGIPHEVCQKWWLTLDARGGRDTSGQPVINWQSSIKAFAQAWKARESDSTTTRPQSKATNADAATPRIWELKTVLEEKRKLAKAMEDRWYSEVAGGRNWTGPEDKRQEFNKLRASINELQKKLANVA